MSSISYDVAFTVKNASSDHESAQQALPDGGRWRPEPALGEAWVDVQFGTEFSIHSVSFMASGASQIQILLQGRKGERGSWFGAGATPTSWGLATSAYEAYVGPLSASECRRVLTCRSSGEGLKPAASQQQWTGMRIVLTPAAVHEGNGEPFSLRRLEVFRQPTDEEAKRHRAARAAAQPAGSSMPGPRPPTAQNLAAQGPGRSGPRQGRPTAQASRRSMPFPPGCLAA